MFTFPTKKGMTNYKAIKLFKEAIKKPDKEQIRAVYFHALENNLNAIQLLKSAKSSVKADITYDDKSFARDILTELKGLDITARQDAFKIYKDKGVLTPNVLKQIERLIQNASEIKAQQNIVKKSKTTNSNGTGDNNGKQ